MGPCDGALDRWQRLKHTKQGPQHRAAASSSMNTTTFMPVSFFIFADFEGGSKGSSNIGDRVLFLYMLINERPIALSTRAAHDVSHPVDVPGDAPPVLSAEGAFDLESHQFALTADSLQGSNQRSRSTLGTP